MMHQSSKWMCTCVSPKQCALNNVSACVYIEPVPQRDVYMLEMKINIDQCDSRWLGAL